MTRLREMMLEELDRRNYAQGTTRCYLRTVADFARYFHRPPDQLRPQHIREYQAYLFRERKLDGSSVTQKLAALRFFFIKTLKKPWSVAETPYPKQVRRLPLVLSQEEVARLINSARNPFDQVLLMTLYATGARCAEVARLGHVTRARVSQILTLVHLAPDIQEAILFLPRTQRGRDPVILSDVIPIAMELDWKRQRRAWRRLMGTL